MINLGHRSGWALGLAFSGIAASAVICPTPVEAKQDLFDTTFMITGFGDYPADGDANADGTQFSGRVDARITYRGLWEGALLKLHLEGVGGDNINNKDSGVLLPTNLWAAYPRTTGDSDVTLNFSLIQQLTPSLNLIIGKINAPDLAREAPLVGGNNKGGFLYNGISAPPPGAVLPAYTFGAMLAGKTNNWSYNFWTYDPNNAQGSEFWNHLFSDGVVFNGSVEYSTKFFGLPGSYGVNLVYSTADSVDFDTLLLPPDAEGFARDKSGISFATLKFTQYLVSNPDNPEEGWGVFGFIGLGDGNPNFLDDSYMLGIGGTSPINGRSDDRWGVAWSRYNWSDALDRALQLQLGIQLRDEETIEAYYEAELTDYLRLGVNAMRIRPGTPNVDDYTQVGTRISVTF
jgi:porin